jgi:hypothetical protein
VVGGPGLRLEELRKTSLDEQRLQEITENPCKLPEVELGLRDRHNRFLNHLLARFAEQLTDYSLANSDPEAPTSEHEGLTECKRAFLRQYTQISSARGTAMNSLELATPDNLPGLEQRLKLKLGIRAREEQFYLVEHILLRPMEGDPKSGPLFGNAHIQDPYSLQISFVFPDWPKRYACSYSATPGQNRNFRSFVEQTIREETPAHLTCYVHWLPQADMRQFEAAYGAWLEHRRNYWKNKLGL